MYCDSRTRGLHGGNPSEAIDGEAEVYLRV